MKYAITVVIKKEVLYVLPFGPSAYLAGVIFINRSNSRSAYKELQETKELIISQKVCITIHIYKYINVLKYWDTILGSQHVLILSQYFETFGYGNKDFIMFKQKGSIGFYITQLFDHKTLLLNIINTYFTVII